MTLLQEMRRVAGFKFGVGALLISIIGRTTANG
jgi:hypothetical protein